MLFNSPEFLFVFLPLAGVAFFVLRRIGLSGLNVAVLLIASVAFYGWWPVGHLPLLPGSILFNFMVGMALVRRPGRALLALGVGVDLLLPGYFEAFVRGADDGQAFGIEGAQVITGFVTGAVIHSGDFDLAMGLRQQAFGRGRHQIAAVAIDGHDRDEGVLSVHRQLGAQDRLSGRRAPLRHVANPAKGFFS
jgi:hypothetical protein